MDIQIIDTLLTLEIYGFGGTAANKDYTGTAFRLSGKMWETVKENGVKNKGQNIWVYEPNHGVFAGVELDATLPAGSLLEHKQVLLKQYAYYKHVGPYNLIGQAGKRMTEEINRRGLTTRLPYIEIYGHWNSDDSKLETELFMSLV